MLKGKKVVIEVILLVFIIILSFAVNKRNISVSTNNQAKLPIFRVNTEEKEIALTFDINWAEEEHLDEILQVLKKYDVKGTFFIMGGWINYTDDNKEKLKNILSQIEGAGEVDVMITYESSEEIQPAFNTNTTTEETKEVDQQGGERTVTTSSENKTMITSSSNEPIVIKTNQPKINGVIVVATGAKDLTVKETLYSAVQTALQVQGHQVEIYTK
mgnify:CR=1 FL=1